MASTFTSLHYHIVFGTRYRRPAIDGNLESELHNYIAGIINNHDGITLQINGTTDHLHILCGLSTRTCLADVVRLVKSNSSKWVNARPDRKSRFEWQTGYGAFTVSFSGLDAVRSYIRSQKQHHEKMTFRDELIRLLQRHQIQFETRYLFEDEHTG